MAPRKAPSQRNAEFTAFRASRFLQSMAPGSVGGRFANAGLVLASDLGDFEDQDAALSSGPNSWLPELERFVLAGPTDTDVQLSQVPIEGTLYLFLNGLLLDEDDNFTCDYTSGLASVTETVVASDIVIAHYWYFDRAPDTDMVAPAWTLESHQGVNVSPNDGTCLINTGAAFTDVSADLVPGGGEVCLVFGADKPANPLSDIDFLFLRVGSNPGVWHYSRANGDDADDLVKSISLTAAANYSVSLSGTTLTVKQNGTTVDTVSLNGMELGPLSRHWVGIRGTTSTGSTFDNFTARGGIVSDSLDRPDGLLGTADTGQEWQSSADNAADLFPPYSKTPEDVTGLIWWLDASQMPGYSTGDAVNSWPDLASSNNATQATSSKRPVFRTKQALSHPAVEFDGTDDFLTTALSHSASDYTFYFVVRQDTSDTTDGDYLFDTTTGRIALATPEPGTSTPGWYDGSWRTGGSVTTGRWVVYEYNLANGAGVLYKNGASIVSAAYTQRAIGGTAVNLGTAESGGGLPAFDGMIAEVVVYDHALGLTERAKVNTYLNEKYAFAL